MPLALILCLPRLIRWAIVVSGTRNARAISAVESPPTARSVERHLRRRGEGRMGAEKEQGERVVVVRRLVARSRCEELVGRRPTSRRLLAAPARVIATQFVDYPPRRDGHQPRPRVLGDSRSGPLKGARQQRFLHGVLAQVEPAIPADEDAEDLRRERAEQVLNIGVPRHRSEPVMCMIGRTSTAKKRADGSPVTISVARTMLSQSSM